MGFIDKGVRDIKGKLWKLDADEKRQLLAILRERDDCPEGWKNIALKKQNNILHNLQQAIERLLDPEEFAKNQKLPTTETAPETTKEEERMDYKKLTTTEETPKDQRQLAKPMHRPFWKTKTTTRTLGMKTHSKKKQPTLLK